MQGSVTQCSSGVTSVPVLQQPPLQPQPAQGNNHPGIDYDDDDDDDDNFISA